MQWLFHIIVDKNWECNHFCTQLLIWIKDAMNCPHTCWYELGIQQIFHAIKDGKSLDWKHAIGKKILEWLYIFFQIIIS